MKFPVFDLHCDTAMKLVGSEKETQYDLRANDCHIDLERARALPGYCQCFAIFTTPAMQEWTGKSPVTILENTLERLVYQINCNGDLIRQAYTASDVRENLEKGLMSAVLTLEGTAGFQYDPALLEDLYQVGFRITSLGWNEKNMLAGSHETGGGLTDLGREYVKEA